MGNLEKTILSEAVFLEIGELQFRKGAIFLDVTREPVYRTAFLSTTDMCTPYRSGCTHVRRAQ